MLLPLSASSFPLDLPSVSWTMIGAQLPLVQTLPVELVQQIVTGVLRSQLEDVVFGTQAAPYNDAHPSLALLHLCSVFRRCTIKILEHMWGTAKAGPRSAAPCTRHTGHSTKGLPALAITSRS